uniref:TGF-beta family profile domain-containing protein n=1 Tax=Ciona savignyi TaxID=51511 RepID=H2YIY2_CIOSA
MMSMRKIFVYIGLITMMSSVASSKDTTSSRSTSYDPLLRHTKQKYMMELYREGNPMLKRSDTVQSFSAIESTRIGNKLILLFDVTIISGERVRSSELRFKRLSSLSDVTMVELWQGSKTSTRQRIGNLKIANSLESRTNFDATTLIRRWVNGKSPLTPEPELGVKVSAQAELFIFTRTHVGNIMTAVEERSNRYRRSRSDRRRKRRKGFKSKSRKSSLQMSSSRHNDVEMTYSTQQKYPQMSNDFEIDTSSTKPRKQDKNDYDETKQWQKQQSDVTIIKSRHQPSPTSKPPVTRETPKIETNQRAPHCRRVKFEIDFERIGWGSWIVHPKKYDAYRCEGHCGTPIISDATPTNHASIQSLLASRRPDLGIPQPCCVPTKLAPLSILYYEDGEVKQREHEDMVVTECGCR